MENSFFLKNHRGQIYLLSAMIIIVIIIAFVTISNYSKAKSSTKIYDLGEELGIEGGNVLDYGTYNQFNEETRENLLENFTQTYADHEGEGRELYFIFGNYEKIIIMAYQDLIDKEISLDIGEGGSQLLITKGKYVSEEIILGGKNNVVVTINNIEFDFKLKPGENFYFVIFQEIGGEEHVITG